MDLQSLRPLFDMVLVKKMGLVGVNQSAGILIEDVDNTSFQIVAQVIAVGPGSVSGGRVVQTQVVPGEQVLVPPQSGLEVIVNGEKHILIKELYLMGSCIAVLSKTEQLAEELLSHPELGKKESEVVDEVADLDKAVGEEIIEPTTAPELTDAEKAVIGNVAAQERPEVERSADGERKFTLPHLPGTALQPGENKPLGKEEEDPLPSTEEKTKALENSQGQTATPILKPDSLKTAVKKNITERKTGQAAQKDKVRINKKKK